MSEEKPLTRNSDIRWIVGVFMMYVGISGVFSNETLNMGVYSPFNWQILVSLFIVTTVGFIMILYDFGKVGGFEE